MTQDSKAPFEAYKDANKLLIGGMVAALVIPIVFALQTGEAQRIVSIATSGVAAAAATLMFGAIIGFVFGIPRSLQEGTDPSIPRDGGGSPPGRRAPYAGNTSLEQISDWLTKIIVGVGLTQLTNIPTALAAVGDVVAPGLGDLTGARTFAMALVVFTLLDGFFIGYLWTRLFLPGLFAESDARTIAERAREQGRQEGEQAVVEATVGSSAATVPGQAIKPGGIEGLWVDDNPVNNETERKWITGARGVNWTNVKSTSAAMTELAARPDGFDFVITDMARQGDSRAGYTLLQQMRAAGIHTPVIIYAGANAQEHDAEAKQRGALGSTNSPTALLNLIDQALASRQAARTTP